MPEYLLRFVVWMALRFIYRFKVQGDENLPATGAAILACNHVSFIDAVLLMAASPGPIYFVMDHRIFRVPVLGWLFRLVKAIPIAPYKGDPATYNAAFERAAQVLRGRVHSARMFARWAIARMRGSSSSICESTVLPGA